MPKKQTSLVLEEDLIEWLKSGPGGMADTIRRALQMYRVFGDPIKKIGRLDDDAVMEVQEILMKAADEYKDENKENISLNREEFDGSLVGRYKQPHEYHALQGLDLIAMKAKARNQGFLELRPEYAPEDYDPDTIEVITS